MEEENESDEESEEEPEADDDDIDYDAEKLNSLIAKVLEIKSELASSS